MAEQSQPAPATGTGGGANQENNDDGKQRGRRNRQRTNKPKGNVSGIINIRKERFAGRSEDLKGYIYDVTLSKGGVAYTKTTEEIARYVGEKYTSTGSHVRTAILTLIIPVPTRPTAPMARGTPPVVDPVDQESFKENPYVR
jgi:hypothetical protein